MDEEEDEGGGFFLDEEESELPPGGRGDISFPSKSVGPDYGNGKTRLQGKCRKFYTQLNFTKSV